MNARRPRTIADENLGSAGADVFPVGAATASSASGLRVVHNERSRPRLRHRCATGDGGRVDSLPPSAARHRAIYIAADRLGARHGDRVPRGAAGAGQAPFPDEERGILLGHAENRPGEGAPQPRIPPAAWARVFDRVIPPSSSSSKGGRLCGSKISMPRHNIDETGLKHPDRRIAGQIQRIFEHDGQPRRWSRGRP